jgi:hypothetical protein
MQLACRRTPVKEDHAIITVLQEASSLMAVVFKADPRISLPASLTRFVLSFGKVQE